MLHDRKTQENLTREIKGLTKSFDTLKKHSQPDVLGLIEAVLENTEARLRLATTTAYYRGREAALIEFSSTLKEEQK